ncbi:helix-turn-helix transcriptional regulator [Nocardia sp. NPDC050712]|uniref:helix-turn-helix transcriptional regulator n=1 Tax=Nocardia sp. NPDC050712 TaxID=3155518 RepID=UPI00340807C0
MDRAQLAAFLRRRREGLQPADAGLPVGPRRRTPGLRREEVAGLAGMSPDYYARLEQRRGPQPSTQMLDALARALRLTADERDYLHRVAGHNPPPRTGSAAYVAPALLRVFDRLADTPAMILTQVGEVLVQNHPARALLGERMHYSGLDRSDIYRWFAHPGTERRWYPESDHDRQSRAHVAGLRAAHAAQGPGGSADRIVHELHSRSAEFRALWEQYEVAVRFTDHKTIVHPQIGPIEVDCQVLFTEDQSQALLVLTAAPDTEDADKLQLAAVLGHQQFADPQPER